MHAIFACRPGIAVSPPAPRPDVHPNASAGSHRWRIVVCSLATAALLLAGTTAVLAAPCSLSAPLSTWSFGASSDWDTSTNWSPAGVPNSASQNVCIVDGTSTVTLDINASVASLQLATGNGLSINTGESLNVNGPQLITKRSSIRTRL